MEIFFLLPVEKLFTSNLIEKDLLHSLTLATALERKRRQLTHINSIQFVPLERCGKGGRKKVFK